MHGKYAAHPSSVVLVAPCRISLFSIVPELLCQHRFGFLGTAFGKAICHTLLHVCMFVVCARPDRGQSSRASAGQLLHSSCDGMYNFLYVCALCAYDMCDTLVLKFIMWPRQTRKQDNRTEQSNMQCNHRHRDSHERSNKHTDTHTHAHEQCRQYKQILTECERERESVSVLWLCCLWLATLALVPCACLAFGKAKASRYFSQ